MPVLFYILWCPLNLSAHEPARGRGATTGNGASENELPLHGKRELLQDTVSLTISPSTPEREGSGGSGRPRRDTVLSGTRTRRGALQQERALASVLGERCRALELHPCLVDAAELGEEVTSHARQEVVRLE